MNGQLELEFDDGEILMEKKNVFIYIVPENTIQNFGYHRARDWDISKPSGTCTLIMTAAGDCCHIQLEDDDSHVFGQSVVALYPGRCGASSALNPVSDSSRYFTLKLQQYSGANELIGLGFVNHKDSSDITKTLENFFASHKKLIKAELKLKVPKVESEAKVETYTKTEAVEHKLEKKLPSAMLNKLENGHNKKEEKCMILNIESTGSGHSNEVKCEIVEAEERSPPVISSTEKQKSSENDTLHPAGSETDCAELLPGTTQVQIQLSPELQQTSEPPTVQPEKILGYATDRNACSISAGASRGKRRKRSILKKKKQTSAGLKRPKVFECLLCPVNFTYSILQKKLIIKHLTKFHRIEKSKICRICLLSFESEDQIKEHKALSHYHVCSHCSMTFTSLKKLKFHLKTIHAKIQQSYSNSEEQSSADVLRLNEDQIQPSQKSRPKLSSVKTTAEPNQTFPNTNNNDSSEITIENIVEEIQEEDASWVLTKKLGLVDITGDTEDNEDTILAFRYRARGFGFKCHLCPLIISSSGKSRIPIFTHWAEVHGFDKPYICGRCCLLFYSKRQTVEHNLLEIRRCLQCPRLLDGVLRSDTFLKHMQMNETLQSHYYLHPIFTDDETSDTGEGLTFSEYKHDIAPLDIEEPIQNSQNTRNKNKCVNRPIKRSIRIQNVKLRKLRSESDRNPCNGSNSELDLDTSGANEAQTTTEAPVAMDTDQLSMAPSDINLDLDVTSLNSDPITPDKVNPELKKVEWNMKSNLNDIRILRIPIGYEFCQPGNVPTCYFCRMVINNSNISGMCKMKCMKLVDRMEYRFICSYCSFNSEAPENQDNEFMNSWSCVHCPAKLKHEGALFYHLFAVHDEI